MFQLSTDFHKTSKNNQHVFFKLLKTPGSCSFAGNLGSVVWWWTTVCPSPRTSQRWPVQHPANPFIPRNLLNPAPRLSNGPVPPGLLQLPASWLPGICHQTITTDPECCGTPDIQRSQIYAHHPTAQGPPVAGCYGSHQIQDIGACIPGSQGISPCLYPTAHQTLHTCQTSTLRYLWTSGVPRPSHLHISFTTALCSGPTMVEWPSCGRQNSRDVVHIQTQTENSSLQTASLPPSLIIS